MAIITDLIEKENLKLSGRILKECIAELEKELKPGITAFRLHQIALDYIKQNQAEAPFMGYQGFPHSICVSINDTVVHGLATAEKVFQTGDVVGIDVGVSYKGIITDAARTFLVSENGVDDAVSSRNIMDYALEMNQRKSKNAEINHNIKPIFFGANAKTATLEQKRDLIASTFYSLHLGTQAVKAGKRVGDIGFAVNEYIKKFGYGNVTALAGHGVGYYLHEDPSIPHVGKKGQGRILVENMVIAVEPMITMTEGRNVKFDSKNRYSWDEVKTGDGSLAAHFENTMIVTKKGVEILTQ
ncbi:MAG: type I methionyl aminopeptidase [Patescibacteria group bacterium]